jgi:hypothetical protein
LRQAGRTKEESEDTSVTLAIGKKKEEKPLHSKARQTVRPPSCSAQNNHKSIIKTTTQRQHKEETEVSNEKVSAKKKIEDSRPTPFHFQVSRSSKRRPSRRNVNVNVNARRANARRAKGSEPLGLIKGV